MTASNLEDKSAANALACRKRKTLSPPEGGATRPEDRVPAGVKLAWSAGSVFENIMVNAICAWVMPIFNLGFLVNPVWLGWGQAVPRILDAFVDPIYGYWSDNTRTRWGRRRPWMLGSALFGTLAFVLLWFPQPGWRSEAVFAWFLAFSILCYQAYGMFAISFNALGMELSPDYNERTRVQAWRFAFLTLSGLLLNSAYKMSFFPFFQIGMPNGAPRPEIYGIRGVALLFGVIVLASALCPVLFCRERVAQPHRKEPGEPGDIRLADAFRYTFSNRIFLHFLAVLSFGIFGSLVLPFHVYLVIFYVCGGDKAAGASFVFYNAVVSTVIGLASVPLIQWMATRFGKRAMLLLGQCVLVPGSLATWFLFTPKMPWLFMLYNLIGAVSLGGLLMIYNSVIGDICDLDEIRTRQRREGMYNAVVSLVIKGAFSLNTVIFGYMLAFSGFDQGAKVQSVESMGTLRAIVMLFPAVMGAAAAVLLWLFPLNRARSLRVRAILERRRGRLTPVL